MAKVFVECLHIWFMALQCSWNKGMCTASRLAIEFCIHPLKKFARRRTFGWLFRAQIWGRNLGSNFSCYVLRGPAFRSHFWGRFLLIVVIFCCDFSPLGSLFWDTEIKVDEVPWGI